MLLLTFLRLEERRGKKSPKLKRQTKHFLEAVKAGDIDLDPKRSKLYQGVMVGSERSMGKMAQKMGKSMDDMQSFADRLWSSACVTENWDRLRERGVDVLFEPGTHDYVAYDILWGAQNHPQLPVYHQPNGGHSQTPHFAAAKDEQNREAFLWDHFFGGEPLLSPPTSSHKVDKDKLTVRVSFDEGLSRQAGASGGCMTARRQVPLRSWISHPRRPMGGHGAGSQGRFLDHHHSLEGRGFPYRFFQQPWKSGQWLPAVSIKPLHPSGAFPKMIQ